MHKEIFLISDNCDFPGVYIILNIKNYKCYIGSSRNIKRRLHEHESANPEKGYNTNVLCENQSYEYSNIYWKKVAFDCFVNVKEQRNCHICSTKERNIEIRKFIDNMLKED